MAPAVELYLHRVLLVGDEVHAGLDSGVGPFSQHLLLQLVNIWQGRSHLSCRPHCTEPGDTRRAQPCPRPAGPLGSPSSPTHLRTCRRSCRWLCSASSSCSFSWRQGCRWVDLKACLCQSKASGVSHPCPPAAPPAPPGNSLKPSGPKSQGAGWEEPHEDEPATQDSPGRGGHSKLKTGSRWLDWSNSRSKGFCPYGSQEQE